MLAHTTDTITLQLTANVRTRAVYPFEFEVQLHYKIENNRLTCQQTYVNRGDNAMPFYAGFHAYLATPSARKGKEKVLLNYTPIERLQYNERLTDIVGTRPVFDLPTAITNPEINEQLTRLGADKRIQLQFPEGYTLELNATNHPHNNLFEYMQLYTIADKPFFCAEHWMGYPNAMNTAHGARWLAPQQTIQQTITLKNYIFRSRI